MRVDPLALSLQAFLAPHTYAWSVVDESVDGVLFVAFDEPFVWDDAADKSARVEWALDHGRTIRVNRAFADLHRTSVATLVGHSVRSFFQDAEPPSSHFSVASGACFEHKRSVKSAISSSTWLLVS
jgi:hypothetical protein